VRVLEATLVAGLRYRRVGAVTEGIPLLGDDVGGALVELQIEGAAPLRVAPRQAGRVAVENARQVVGATVPAVDRAPVDEIVVVVVTGLGEHGAPHVPSRGDHRIGVREAAVPVQELA
jgi:hypothetical protein